MANIDPSKLPPLEPDWSYGTFEGAERLRRELAQRTTLAQRLRWVEQTLAFAHKAGVLKPREIPAEWKQAEWKQAEWKQAEWKQD